MVSVVSGKVCFNSTLVQLKGGESTGFHSMGKKFQFYLSSIKRVVPHENCVDRKMFQFYLSSIKRDFHKLIFLGHSPVSILP
ncbi:Uncharacterised protein [Odoribacter splanchnicus]|nr:Uncharacterised protein [Odoribacter splanchnicus]